MRLTKQNSGAAISATFSGAAVTMTTNCKGIAIKLRETEIAVKFDLEVSPDTEGALANESNYELRRATSVAADVLVFDVGARGTIFDTRFYVVRKKFAIPVSSIAGREMGVNGAGFDSRT